MNFISGIIAAMAFLIAVNLGMIVLDIEAGNTLDFTKDAAKLNIKKTPTKSSEDIMMDASTNTMDTEHAIKEEMIKDNAQTDIAFELKDDHDESMTDPVDIEVTIATGSGIPGCEETNECFLPADLSIGVGDTVIWINDDAGHTVTAGDFSEDPDSTGISYPNGFDSGFFFTGNTYSHTFENAGTYPYYCVVHPWMQGTVTVL